MTGDSQAERLENEPAAPMRLADPDPASVSPQEFGTLGALMANAYRRQVNFYRKEYEKSLPEAMEMAVGADSDAQQAAFIAGLRELPPDQVTWGFLRHLEDGEPGDALRKWEEVKAWAHDELTSGMRGAAAVEDLTPSQSGPLGRARYSVLVQEMAKDWQPLTGIEYLLVEQMAQAYTMQLYWTALFGHREVYNIGTVDHEQGRWDPPTISRQQALDSAAAMVDRWNRMFLRCLRQLRDLRRYGPVVIHNPGQVNVGGQQVNMNKQEVAVKKVRGKRRVRHSAGD